MNLSFRQGIVQCSHDFSNKPNFLQLIGGNVYISTTGGPLLVSFSQGASEYLLREKDNSQINAFSGPFASNLSYWFYWDLDVITGLKTYGSTTLQPVSGSVAPSSPAVGQHWFSTTDVKMYVWNGTTWINKIRAFAGMLQNVQVTNTYGLIGGNSVQKTFYVSGNITAEFVIGDQITITSGGSNNGSYNVAAYVFNTGLNRTEITVQQTVPSPIISGFLSHTPSTSFTIGQLVAFDVGTQVGNYTPILSGFIFYDQNGNAVKLVNGQFFTTESPFILATGQTQPLKLEETFIFGNVVQNMAAYQIVSVDSSDPTKLNPATYEDTSNKILGIILNNALIGQQALTAIEGVVDNPNWNWAGGNVTLWVDNGNLVTIDPFISDPVHHPVKAPPVARSVNSTKIIFSQGLGGLGLTGPQGLPGNQIKASATVLGSVYLTLDPVVAATPLAVGDNDPRMTNARTPLAHNQVASTINVSAIAPVIPVSTDGQTALGQIVTELGNKVSKTGDIMSGTLNMNLAATVTGIPLPIFSSDAVPYGLLLSTVLNYVPLAGGTMTGPLILNADPVTGLGAATKQYVDGLVASGITWRKPIQDPDLTGIATVVPGAPVADTTYLAYGGVGYPQTWGNLVSSVLSGDVLTWDGSIWTVLFNIFTSPPSNEFWRLGINMQHGTPNTTLTNAPLSFRKNDIVQWVPGASDPTSASSWTFPDGRANNGAGGPYIPQGVTVLVDNANSLHFGHTYLYNNVGNTWIEINALGVSLNFTQLNDVPHSYVVGDALKVVRVNAAHNGLEFHSEAFTDLVDVPSSYAGQALKLVRVNATATGLEFVVGGGGSSALSGITPAVATNTITNADWQQNWRWTTTDTSYPIIAVTDAVAGTTNGSFTIAGDQTNVIYPGSTIQVVGSTGNDSVYVVLSSVFGGVNTVITVFSPTFFGLLPSDATADGSIYPWTTEFAITELAPLTTANNPQRTLFGLSSNVGSIAPIFRVSSNGSPNTDDSNLNGTLGNALIDVLKSNPGDPTSGYRVNLFGQNATPFPIIAVTTPSSIEIQGGDLTAHFPAPAPNPVMVVLTDASGAGNGNTYAITTSSFNVGPNTTTLMVLGTTTITGVVPGLNGVWTITGDFSPIFVPGYTFVVVGNTGGGDGTYSVLSSNFLGGDTNIIVNETIPGGATADGTVSLPALVASTVADGSYVQVVYAFGGDVSLQAGNNAFGDNGAGLLLLAASNNAGPINLTAGSGFSQGSIGGNVNILAGNSNSAEAGTILLLAGSTGGTGTPAGDINLVAGNIQTPGTGVAGRIHLLAGANPFDPGNNGGSVTIESGAGTNGGDITLSTSAAIGGPAGPHTGGKILLQTGAGTNVVSGGHAGEIQLKTGYRIQENDARIYELSGNVIGTDLNTGDGESILIENQYEAGVFTIQAVGIDFAVGSPAVAVTIRGSYLNANGSPFVIMNSIKETWCNTAFDILSVNSGTKTFTVYGDQSAAGWSGNVYVVGTPAGINDGTYTFVSVTFNASTTTTDIVVSEAVNDQGKGGVVAVDSQSTSTVDVSVATTPNRLVVHASGGLRWTARAVVNIHAGQSH